MSKESSFIFVDSKESPQSEKSPTKGKVASDAGPKTKEANPKDEVT